ncbi:helix-turn-helix domain-containing protein [Streptomyces noursei]|uniref:helix-turn-helix domain-containing protein n=1 Tax=Streptomyces noursei TaxID=1971 RepID=UPI00167886DB|nr:helix-turn-helix transcriptional regulator [Streptomyces noursei]MCZ1015639.1 helix-turn-helix transcriptional regulator [Streptomyces noursei]GGW89674.1 transcriptional regulator [Streptomyces noursei]
MPAKKEVDPSAGLEQYIGHLVQEARLARRRTKHGGEDWSQSYLASRVFVAQSRISEVETAEVPPDKALAGKLEAALGLPKDSLVNLVGFLEEQTVRDYAKSFLRRQKEADMFHVAAFTIPGLLQTPDYARELLLAGQAGDPRDIDSFVDQCMARQDVWDREDPPWMNLVLSEAALHQTTVPQLERLLRAQESPNISVQVLPFNSGHIIGMFYVLTLPDGTRASYTEGFNTGNYSEDTAEVLRYQKVYDRLAGSALTTEASTVKIHEALTRLK